jgi:hypothetical protein
MAVHAAFTEELAGPKDRDDRFLALLGQDGELDPAFLNVKDRVGNVALFEHVLIFVKFQYRLSRSYFGEKDFRVKHVLDRLHHGSLV